MIIGRRSALAGCEGGRMTMIVDPTTALLELLYKGGADQEVDILREEGMGDGAGIIGLRVIEPAVQRVRDRSILR